MKKFLEEYGFAILAAIVVILLIAMCTPVGTLIKTQILGVVTNFGTATTNQMKQIDGAVSGMLDNDNNKESEKETEFDINVWRDTWSGKSLGSTITAEQFDEIDSGKLTTIGLGDYWTIDNTAWRVADYAYYSNNDLVLVPDESLGTMVMNPTPHTNATGYYGSAGRTTLNSTIKDALPEIIKSNLYAHDITVSTATSSSSPYTNTWETKSSDGIELMTSKQVFGETDNLIAAFKNEDYTEWNYGFDDKGKQDQLAIFRFDASGNKIADGSDAVRTNTNVIKSYNWWLASTVYTESFALIYKSQDVLSGTIAIESDNSGFEYAIRPVIVIK